MLACVRVCMFVYVCGALVRSISKWRDIDDSFPNADKVNIEHSRHVGTIIVNRNPLKYIPPSARDDSSVYYKVSLAKLDPNEFYAIPVCFAFYLFRSTATAVRLFNNLRNVYSATDHAGAPRMSHNIIFIPIVRNMILRLKPNIKPHLAHRQTHIAIGDQR